MPYQLTGPQKDKFALFGLDQSRLAELAATVTDKYTLAPREGWAFVVTDCDCYQLVDKELVKEITKSCRVYGDYLDAMEAIVNG